MERVEYRVNETKYPNRIGLSIKYPDGIQRKWSERDVRVVCDECGSDAIETDLSGDALTLTCIDCPNWWSGQVDSVLTWYDSEEATIRLPDGFKPE